MALREIDCLALSQSVCVHQAIVGANRPGISRTCPSHIPSPRRLPRQDRSTTPAALMPRLQGRFMPPQRHLAAVNWRVCIAEERRPERNRDISQFVDPCDGIG